jgi:hypothetical protein
MKNRKIICSLISLLIFCSVFFYNFSLLNFNNIKVYAMSNTIIFDEVDVLDDLQTSTWSGKPFNINDYPYNEQGQLQIINFVEYCYSFRSNLQYNYGLYIYVYNPQAININTDSFSNKIQMASEYEDGEPTEYTKYNLKFCSKSVTNYYNLFYKFKIDFSIEQRNELLSRLDSHERRYDISGVELFAVGATNSIDYSSGKFGKITVTGYSKGYGANLVAESNLSVNMDDLEFVEFNLGRTFWRGDSFSDKGADHYNQLDSVYFSVPNKLLDYYGELQRIKAEWYEYKTKNILVTKSAVVADWITPRLGQRVEPFSTDFNRSLYYNLDFYSQYLVHFVTSDWAFNPDFTVFGNWFTEAVSAVYDGANINEYLYLLFKVNNIDNYNKQNDIVSIGGVTGTKLSQAIYNYDKSYINGTLPIKDGTISADLFEDFIDSDRIKDTEFGKIQKGYSYYDFDADRDLQSMLSYADSDISFWQKWQDMGLWDAIFGNEIAGGNSITGIVPIISLRDDHFYGSKEEISENLFISVNDVYRLQDYYETAKDNDETTFLFRFATSDYFAGEVIIKEPGLFGATLNDQCYIASETVFLDFDVIQLTFLKDGIYKVIPVVSNPIDIINDLVPPSNIIGFDLWAFIKKWALIIVVLIIGIILLPTLLPYIVKLVVWVISLPFVFVKYLFGLFKGGG